MKLICLVKFVPDVDNFKYDFEKNVLIRENTDLVLNPDDAKAIAFALKVKALNPEITVEILSMGPKNVVPKLEDLLRLKVDKATLISDSLFVGSDTYVTSQILAKQIASLDYDCILTGTHSLDGDTAHVPSQIAQCLSLNHLTNVIDVNNFSQKQFNVSVDSENFIETYEVSLPIVLSFSKESKLKLPYIKFEDIDRDVSNKLQIIDNTVLNFDKKQVGLEGSLTKVIRSFVKRFDKKEKLIVQCDEEGVSSVYRFLKHLGYIK